MPSECQPAQCPAGMLAQPVCRNQLSEPHAGKRGGDGVPRHRVGVGCHFCPLIDGSRHIPPAIILAEPLRPCHGHDASGGEQWARQTRSSTE